MANIIIVDDSHIEAELVKISISGFDHDNEIKVLNDGKDLVEYLQCNGSYANRDSEENELIKLILLDINMPRMGGIEALKIIKKNPATKDIPVVMFSSSDLEVDVKESYTLGANGYVKKPIQYDLFNASVEKIIKFWVQTNLTCA